MSDSEKKIKAPLFHSAKSRVFIALALIVIGIAAIAFIVHWRSNIAANAASAGVSGAPSISSVPGAGNPSAAYIKAQTEANVAGEVAARKAASSYVPTVTRAGFVGNPDQFGQISSDSNSAPLQCPLSKTVVMYKPNPANCTLENLKLARDSGVTAEELLCQGCACPLLKAAGYSIGDLKAIGLSATQLRACGFTLQELVHAGFSAADLRDAGFSAQDLKNVGFTAGELKSAGFSATDLKAAGFTAADLKNAGFTAGELKSAGFSAAALKAAGVSTDLACDVKKLEQERASGMSATALRQQGCGLAALKAAGFSAGALREAGFTAGQLKTAGFTAKELHDAGFSARQLKNAGYSATELKNAGFSAADLKNAGFSAGALKSAGFSARQLAAAGFTAKQLRSAGYSAADLKNAGFSAADLKAAGFTKGDLLRAGFNAAESGYPAETPQIAPSQSDNVNAATNTLLPSINANSPEAKLAQFEKQQQADMNAQQKADEIQRMQGFMSQQANKLLVGWGQPATQTLQNAPETKSESGSGNGTNAASAVAAAALHGPILKAGTVLFAVIETSINSDENTPIMAHIVSGPLKGSKLLGSFSRQHKRLLITFAMLNDPHYPNSIGINAVAIDPDTARTAISGQVNSHYMLRYGTLFAASFLQGVSEGIMNTGVTSTCLVPGLGCTLQQVPLNTKQQIMVGLGKVGQSYSQEMGSNFNRAPTVRIAAGTGIGVLLMGDLTLPKNPQDNNS